VTTITITLLTLLLLDVLEQHVLLLNRKLLDESLVVLVALRELLPEVVLGDDVDLRALSLLALKLRKPLNEFGLIVVKKLEEVLFKADVVVIGLRGNTVFLIGLRDTA